MNTPLPTGTATDPTDAAGSGPADPHAPGLLAAPTQRELRRWQRRAARALRALLQPFPGTAPSAVTWTVSPVGVLSAEVTDEAALRPWITRLAWAGRPPAITRIDRIEPAAPDGVTRAVSTITVQAVWRRALVVITCRDVQPEADDAAGTVAGFADRGPA
jgi:hypothetical protein